MNTFIFMLKHLNPSTWLKAMVQEAEHAPATVLGIFSLWTTIVLISFLAWTQYTQDALADEERFTSIQVTIRMNTTALECASADRRISHKTREIANVQRLLALAQDETEKRDYREQASTLQRELANEESGYAAKCL